MDLPEGEVLNGKTVLGRRFRCLQTTSEREVQVNVGPLLLAVNQSGTAQGALFLSPKPLLERSSPVRASGVIELCGATDKPPARKRKSHVQARRIDQNKTVEGGRGKGYGKHK